MFANHHSGPVSVAVGSRLAGAVFAVLLAGGCASAPSASTGFTHTLAADRRLPAKDLEQFFGSAQWQTLGSLEYEAFVLVDAQIRADGSLRLGNVRESFPDSSWNDLARSFAQEAELRAAAIGSHIDPGAEVFVVFFKRQMDGNLALIFARQKGEPGPGMTQRATYLRTRRY